ncbi:MAG TPA: N-acetylmuramoyl-L-alanine amidase-like domain-containing protein [Chthoniobacterales bacterium]
MLRIFALLAICIPTALGAQLPLSTTFKGTAKFHRLVSQAQSENWRALPIGDRTARVGMALLGTPYVNYTLEIDDHIEAPSVNLNGLDCWTFYEVSLAFARMIKAKPVGATPQDLLKYIELERYRGGKCTGSYLSRMHFLEEVFADNTRRGLSVNPTRDLGGVRISRNITEMTSAWRSYRYLVHNRNLLPGMATIQQRVSALPVYYIPRSKVAGIEKYLRSGDIIAIVSADRSGYTSHVGMAVKRPDGTHYMHATSSRSHGRKVVLDDRISQYLKRSSDHIGIIVYRPLDI